MKVLYITHYLNMMGGANRSMIQLILELKEKGVDPTVMMPLVNDNNPNELKSILLKYDIPYIEAPIRNAKTTSWMPVLNYVYMLCQRRAIFKLLRSMKFDIVHTNSSVIDIGASLSKRIGAVHVWHLREFGDLDYNLKTPFGKWFQRVIYGGNSDFIAISTKIASHYSRYINPQKIHLIYNGIKKSGLKRENVCGGMTRFCIVGLLCENKRQYDVLEAINELVHVRGISQFHVSIIGFGDEAYTARLKDYVTANQLDRWVTFTGATDNVAELLTTMDVGIMASSNEAFGRVTVEYMMSGLAVIASDGGANCEIVEDGVSGLIYSACDYKSLADKMEVLICDRKILQYLARKGRELAVKRFSSEVNSRQIYELYNKLLHT